MKKVKFIVILCTILMFGVQSVNAQWFQDREIRWFSNDVSEKSDDYAPDRGTGSEGGGTGVPIGSGVAILFGLGVGYACVKRSRNED